MTDAELTVIFGHIDTLVPLHQGQHSDSHHKIKIENFVYGY